MLNRKEKLSILGRIFTIVACFVLGLFVLFNVNRFMDSSYTNNIIQPAISTLYNQQNKDYINLEFRKMMIKHPDISSVVMYKFISDKGTSMYTGQVNITSEASNGQTIPNDNTIVSMVDSTTNIQEILLNNIHYENIETIQLLCENKFDISKIYTCEKYKRIGSKFKSIVSIPIVQNIDVGVVGYLMITLHSEYDNLQVQELVNELRPYITSIQPLVK